MNAIPLLGIHVQHCDGQQILPPKLNTCTSSTSSVNLIMSIALPSHKGRVVRAKITSNDVPITDGEFLFEPNQEAMGDHGLTALESVVIAKGGEVLVPIENHSGTTLHMKS